MDNQPFTNTIHVFLQDPDNDVDTEDTPELVSLDAPGSHATEPQPQTTADVDMNGEDSNMPPLYSLDEDHDNNHDSESDQDAREVEMQTVNHRSLSEHAVPNPARTSHTSQGQPAVNNRRARVEDDEDEDRDRRHPSQRIGNSANALSSAGPSSSALTLPLPSQTPSPAPPAVRFRGQAPIFNRPVVDEVRTTRAHPFRFFQHLMSNNNNNNIDNNAAGNTNPVPPDGPMPAPQPHQDGNTPDDQPHGRRPIIEGFSVTLDIGLGPTFRVGEGAQPPEREGAQPEGEPASNIAHTNPDGNPDAQNRLSQTLAEFMARFGLIGQALGDNGAEQTTEAGANGGNNPNQGAGGVGPTPGAQFGFNFPAGGFNLANLAGLGFGFNLDGSGFAEKEDPQRARLLVDGLEEVPVGLVKRLERVGGTGGGMGEDETKGGDGGCAICWDRLLGSVEENQHEKGENKEEDSERVQLEASEKSNEASKPSAPKIVSLPCAHVFHAECLIPWFSRPRQTTCPTCRFNIDPENLTYVSWRRRMRERRERERAEARARGDQENTNGNEPSQGENAPPTGAAATMAGDPPAEPIPDVPSFISEHALNFLSSLHDPPLVRSQTPVAEVLNVHRTSTPRSQSQPPAVRAEASSSSSSSAIGPSTSQSTTQTHSPHEGGSTDPDIHGHAQEGADDWEGMPGLQDMSDSDDEESNEDDEDEDEDEEEGNETQEQDGRGTQAPPVLPHANEPAIAPTQRPRQNVPLAPRTIQTTHGLVTLIPVPINFPFPSAGNGVGVGVQAGGNVANGSAPGEGQLPNVNANVNNQAFPQGFPHGIALPHSAVQLPHMPEFGAHRGPQGAGPPPPAVPVFAGTTGNDANANPNQAIPANPFVNAQEAAAITNTEEQLIQHLLLQGVTADEAESFRRSSLTGRQADRLRRGEDPVARPESEDGGNEDLMMDIDEGMSMVVDMTMEQGGIGSGPGAEPTAMAQDDQDRQEFAQVINFLNNAARQAEAQAQAQAGTQTQGQAQAQGTQGVAAANPSAQGDAPQPQQQQQQQTQQQQQQGQGFVPFMAGLNAGFNIGNHIGTFGPADGAAMNEFLAQMFANLTGGSPERRRQAQEAQRQNVRPQPQPQPQAQAQPQPEAGQEPAEGAIPTNANNGRRRQQAHFAFGNVTIGPFTNIESLFDQIPIFNPNGGANGGAGNGQERVKKAWTLPAAPGPTLRERIERKERDAGLRCYDVSCGVGPSDEDPIVSDETIAAGLRQLMIMNKNHGSDGKAEGTCPHTFHPGCLVSAERVALGGAGVNVIESGDVEVSCPVCRSAGCVTKQQWDEGISALA